MNNAIQTTATGELALLRPEFSVKRTSKSGKVTERTMLGVMLSGTKAERELAINEFVLQMWEKSNLNGVVRELNRVFPKLGKEIESRNAAVNNVIATHPEFAGKVQLIRTTGVRKMDVMAMFALASQLPGADKGEKAKLLAAGRAINDYEIQLEKLRAETAQQQPAVTQS